MLDDFSEFLGPQTFKIFNQCLARLLYLSFYLFFDQASLVLELLYEQLKIL